MLFYPFTIIELCLAQRMNVIGMKRIGCCFEYERERNEDLLRAYRECMGKAAAKDLFQTVVNMPSRRFWVSPERATIVVCSMIKGKGQTNMLKNKKEMYQEIYRRVLELKRQNPNTSIYDLVIQVVDSPAPKFYLTPKSARVIIYKIRRHWYDSKKKKLMFM